MEEAPTPLIKTPDKGGEMKTYKELENMDIFYEIIFKPKNKEINIECNNTKDNSNEKYYYKLTEKEIIRLCGDFNNFIDKIDSIFDKLELKKSNDKLLLIIIFGKNNKQEKLVLPMKPSSEEIKNDKEINDLKDAFKLIKELIEENRNIKNELNKVKQNFQEYKEKMETNLSDYKAKVKSYFFDFKTIIDLNFLYNSFDPKTYKLDYIYKNLPSKVIIRNEWDFGLINRGIHDLFKKNIIKFEIISKYDSKDMNFNFDKFKEQLDNSKYSILIILTQDKKRFGAFYRNKEKKNDINQNNQINQGILNPYENPQINNINNNIFGYNEYNNNNNFINNEKYSPLGNLFQNRRNNLFDNIMNQGNQINQMNGPKIAFNSSSSEKEYFVFSFDSSKIFYSNHNCGNNIIPSFNINLEEEILKGYENPIGNAYELAGISKFNIIRVELYSIQFGYL